MQALLVSNLLLWIAVVALCVLVVVLIRQVGLLHERIAPVGALAQQQGPRVGEPVPALQLSDLSGAPVTLGAVDGVPPGERTLLFFLSPTCPVCDSLLPTLRRVVLQEAQQEPGLRLVVASDGDPEEHLAFRRDKQLEDVPYVLSTDLGLRFAVAKLPTAVLIDEAGVLRAKGMVNTREHLESLFNAAELGVASIQDYLQREAPASAKGGENDLEVINRSATL